MEMSRVSPFLARLCLASSLALALSAPLSLPAGAEPAAAAQQREPLEIVSKNGTHAFSVEVMRDDASRARGLMFRRSMPANQGMLFDFGVPQPVAMWMKNTYLPLDMVFIRKDGTIARIAADTEPLSTQVIPSNEPVISVLELNAGTAASLGLQPGDRVRHPLFGSR